MESNLPGMKDYQEVSDQAEGLPLGEPLTLEKLKEYLMEIFHKRLNETWGQNILLYKYCAHQNRMVTLSSDPDRNECEMCLAEIIFKPKYELFGKRKKKRFSKVRSLNQNK